MNAEWIAAEKIRWNQDVLGYSLTAVTLILPGVVGLTFAAKAQSPGSAFLRAVLVTTGLGTALGFGGVLLFFSVYPPGAGIFPIWFGYLLGAFYAGGAGLAVGLLGGGLIAWLKVARAGRMALPGVKLGKDVRGQDGLPPNYPS
jgi:hypothetical protein